MTEEETLRLTACLSAGLDVRHRKPGLDPALALLVALSKQGKS